MDIETVTCLLLRKDLPVGGDSLPGLAFSAYSLGDSPLIFYLIRDRADPPRRTGTLLIQPFVTPRLPGVSIIMRGLALGMAPDKVSTSLLLRSLDSLLVEKLR
jgi:hypothetical protein